MKVVFKKVIELLGEIAELRFVDLDKGQIDFYETRPAVAFPCALIKIDLPQCENRNAKVQQVRCGVSLRVCFGYLGETTATTPLATRDAALNYFDVIEKIYVKLQGTGNTQINPFTRKSAREENRQDGLKVFTMNFETGFIDETAKV